MNHYIKESLVYFSITFKRSHLVVFCTYKTLINWNVSCAFHQFNIFHLYTATEYHLGVLKAKLAKYRSQLLEPQGKKGEKGEGFDVMKSGDARVALIGFPSVGKVSDSYKLWVYYSISLLHYCIEVLS